MPTGLQTSGSHFLSWLSFHEQSQDFFSFKMSLAKALDPPSKFRISRLGSRNDCNGGRFSWTTMERMIAIYLYSSSSVVRENFKPFPWARINYLSNDWRKRAGCQKAIFYDMLTLTSAKHAEDSIESFEKIPMEWHHPSLNICFLSYIVQVERGEG